MAYPGYPQQPQQGYGAPQQPGQQPPRPGQPGAPQGYPQQGGYPGQPGQPGAPQGYPQQGGYPGQPGQPGAPQGYPQQGGYPGQPGQPGAPQGYPQQGGYPGQPGAPGAYPGQAPPGQQPGGGLQQPNWASSLYDQIPPQELARLQQWFAGVDRDRSGSISAPELSGVVFGGKPIGQLTATKLIKVFDRDNSGTIDFKEYAALNQYLMNMFNAFSTADRDRSGFVDAQEIHQAMAGAGFQLSIGSITALVNKFSTPGRGVDIANFLFICAHLGHLRSIFEWNDSDRDGKVTLTYDSLTHIGTEIL